MNEKQIGDTEEVVERIELSDIPSIQLDVDNRRYRFSRIDS